MPTPGTLDSFVQVAPDSTGKKMVTVQGTDAQGNTVQFEVAMIVGDVPDLLNQIRDRLTDLLAVNRATLAILQQIGNLRVEEDDFRLP